VFNNVQKRTAGKGLPPQHLFARHTAMASQLMGSNVRLPTRSPAFRSQQPRSAVSRPSVGSSMHGSSYSSVGTTFGMPSASSSRTANRRVVTMAAKGELHDVDVSIAIQLSWCATRNEHLHWCCHCCCHCCLKLLSCVTLSAVAEQSPARLSWS